jgi:magnesium-transporting ATPase (P-type)
MIEKDLVVAGVFGLKDPLRPGIQDAVKKCKKSGINVRMCTGDNIDTAIAISREAGILGDDKNNDDESPQGYTCMTGEEFRNAVGGLIEDPKSKKKAKIVKN